MNKTYSTVAVWLALMVFLLPGRSAAEGAESSEKPLLIAVSILPEVGLVKRIGGDFVDVTAVVSPGESPTTYQPSDRQMSRILRSELYFCLGMPFENGPWFGAVRQHGGVELVDLREGLDLLPDGRISPEQTCRYLPGRDPHVWLSPKRLAIMSERIASSLAKQDPTRRPVYDQNLESLLEEIAQLDAFLSEHLAPLSGKPFFVYHPTWGYLADDFGLQQVAVEEHGSAPSDHQMTALRRRFSSSGSRYLFVQPQIAGRSAASAATVLGAELREVDPLAADTLGSLRSFVEVLEASLR